jgi:hypothetical protein
MSTVEKRRQTHPVIRPIFHILVMGAPEELDGTEFPILKHFPDFEEVSGIYRRFHDTIGFFIFPDSGGDGFKIIQLEGHGHSTSAVFSRVKYR